MVDFVQILSDSDLSKSNLIVLFSVGFEFIIVLVYRIERVW